MKTTTLVMAILMTTFSPFAWSQQPQPDPIGENLFPPELLMQHQKELGLTEDQKSSIKAEMLKVQSKFTDVQWQLQSEIEGMGSLLQQTKADEQQVLSQLEKILSLEREIKRTQIGLIIRIKNRLSAEQQKILQEIKNKVTREIESKMGEK